MSALSAITMMEPPGAGTPQPAIATGRHTQTISNPAIVPRADLGPVGVGAVNLTARQLPPQRPNAVLEQGVGRSHVTAWERQDHWIHDNPDWYLGIGALFQPADFSPYGGAGPMLQTPIPLQTQMELLYIQNREEQSVPGARSSATVPMPAATTQTALSRLPAA